MRDTAGIRQKMMEIWSRVDSGDMTHQEARVHIGLARTVLDTLKVEIAAAHLNVSSVPPVSLGTKPVLTIAGRVTKKKAA